jgi:hypothetical protein
MGPVAASSTGSLPARRRRAGNRPAGLQSAPAFRPAARSCWAFNSRITSLRNTGSSPGPTRTIGPPISISIVAALEVTQFSATIGTNRTQERPRLPPQPPAIPGASHKADCGAARSTVQSRSSPPPAPGSRRQSPPSPPCSSAAGAASCLEPQHDGNCAHQLANYLAHQPRSLAQMKQHQPIAVTRRNVGVNLRLLSMR